MTKSAHTTHPPGCPHGDHAPLAAPEVVHEHHLHDHDHHGHDHDHAHAHHGHHDHAHGHGHGHQHEYRATDKKALMFAFAITVSTMVLEIVTGVITHSLALVSDGIHMFTHAFALAISWVAIVLATRPANLQKTFGYYRIEVLAAFVNGLTILGSAVWIVVEGITRLIVPEPIDIGLTLGIAVFGLLVNVITGLILMRADQSNLNIRSSFMHMLTDALSSVAIIIGLIVIHYTGWTFIDPLLALVVAVVITRWSWGLLTDSFHILLEGSPVDIKELAAYVTDNYPEVRDVHDVHIWQIAQRFNCLTAHLTIAPEAVASYPDLVKRINDDLREEFDIGHTNFQPEWG